MPTNLILGGRRSGKSAFAETQARALNLPLTYLATSRTYDRDHADRIDQHQRRRLEQGWRLVEVPEPLDLQQQLTLAMATPGAIVVDCLSMWLNNLFLDQLDIPKLVLPPGPAHLFLVSSEVGQGVHPETALGRRYADALGILNQSLAAQADQVRLIVAGLPLVLKAAEKKD